MNSPLQKDMWPAVILIGVGAYGLYEAVSMSTFGAIFPQFAAGGMILGGLILVVRVLFNKLETAKYAGELNRPLILISILLFWAISFPLLGFIISSIISGLLAMLTAQQEKIPLKSYVYQLGGILALILVIDHLFVNLLNVPLP